MEKRTIVEKGGPDAALFLYCHFDPNEVRQSLGGRHENENENEDAVVVERWGEGTSSYRPLLDQYGGFSAWVAEVAAACEKESFSRVCLTTWSAGSQVAKDVCGGDDWPEAILMMDGLYGDKPAGSRPGDGKVCFDEGLQAIARYALAAARDERVMAILHSRIPTSYASSKECAAAVRCWVEVELEAPLQTDDTAEAALLGAYESAVSVGSLHIVGFPGSGPSEHVREGRLHEVCRRLWFP